MQQWFYLFLQYLVLIRSTLARFPSGYFSHSVIVLAVKPKHMYLLL